MALLRPSFDPVAREWFAPDGRTSKTLAAFPLRRGEAIADYYGSGETWSRRATEIMQAPARGYQATEPTPAPPPAPPPAPVLPPPAAPAPAPRDPRPWRAPAPRAKPPKTVKPPRDPAPWRPPPPKLDPAPARSERGAWTEAEARRLRGLAAFGYSASGIGAMLGRTRNSVIGKADRLGIKLRGG